MVQHERNTNRFVRGFTLIESMIVVAVLAIATTLAVPSLNGIIIKNRLASISNEFTFALQQTRALAISKNSCATICASTNVSSNLTTGNTCSNGSSDDFQKGWIVFVNPACDGTQTDPSLAGAPLTSQRQAQTTGYSISPSSASFSMVMFDPRGFATLTAAGNFQVTSPSADPALKRLICLDVAGRATVRGATASCS